MRALKKMDEVIVNADKGITFQTWAGTMKMNQETRSQAENIKISFLTIRNAQTRRTSINCILCLGSHHLVSYDREEFHFICQHAKCLNKISIYQLFPSAWILITL